MKLRCWNRELVEVGDILKINRRTGEEPDDILVVQLLYGGAGDEGDGVLVGWLWVGGACDKGDNGNELVELVLMTVVVRR